MGLIAQGPQANPQYVYGYLAFDAVQSSPLAGTVDNLNVDGMFFASQLTLLATTAITLTGLAQGRPGKVVQLVNESAFDITLSALAGGSVAANQFQSAALLAAGASIQLTYSGNLSKWIPTAGTTASGAGPTILGTVISPAALAIGTTADYAPTGIASAQVARLTPNAGNSALSGIIAPVVGQQLWVYNIGAGDLTFLHATGSAAANQFLCPGSVDHTLPANDSAVLWYDLTSAKWRVG
jgi:hypothetical protein